MTTAPPETTADAAPPDRDERAARIMARVERAWDAFKRGVVGIFNAFRFVFFAVYLILAALAFWLWFFRTVLFVVRLAVRTLMTVFLWIAEGVPQEPDQPRITVIDKIRDECRFRWQRRHDWYRDMARPLARHTHSSRRAVGRFWYWPIQRKIAAVVFTVFLIYIPGLYVIPRVHYIQLIDDNAIDYDNQNNIRYIVHGADLFNYGKTREYINEDAWWFGKINSQILKNEMQPGRYYKLWVVGIRWWWLPTLYPNIVAMTETDANGVPLAIPSHFIPPTTTGK